jgi:hypothetical protein
MRDGLVSKAEYGKFWSILGKVGKPLEEGSEPFWKELQEAFNRSLRELFLQGIKEHIACPTITIDDDKMHYAADPHLPTDGLKLQQHVKDNRKGFVDNHIVLTASGTLLGIDFETEGDENSNSSSMRLIRKQLCPLQSGSRVPDLTGYSLLADRLYWSLEFEHDFVLASGMDVEAATHKRDQNFGFTYDQYKGPADKRRHIPLGGQKVSCSNYFILLFYSLGSDRLSIASLVLSFLTIGIIYSI